MSEVQRFYDGKCLFVTGVTGFVGKFLLEKILRSCNPSCVYVLIRKKRGLSSEKRLKQFLEKEPVFHFKPLDPSAVNKVIAVDGNIEQESIFSRKEDLHEILTKVNVVIHSAATVRFTEKFE
jgi:fatty acyl-CoA reductase